MSASYNELLLTDLDRARSMLGDINVTPASNALHSNEHINAVLDEEDSFEAAIAYLADELVVRFGQDPVKIAGDGSSLDFSARIPAWQALATRMRGIVEAAAASAVNTPAATQAICTQAVW